MDGRLLAQTAAVTVIDDTINASDCCLAAPTPPTTTTPVTGSGGIAEGTLPAISELALLGTGAAPGAIRRPRSAARSV